MLGQIFFLLFFVFSLTCYRVFFFFSLSGILLITLLCYVLYVNFVIVCYLAFFLPLYVSISETALVEVDVFSSVAPTSSAFGMQLRFHRFSLISFCSRPKVVFLYCNYYFFALCRDLLSWFVNSKNICWSWTCCVFGIGPCPFNSNMDGLKHHINPAWHSGVDNALLCKEYQSF